MDPTRLRIADISESVVDPLARAMRQRLKRDYDITSGITVVFSTEKPCCHLVPVEEGQDPLDFQVIIHLNHEPVLSMTLSAWPASGLGLRVVLCLRRDVGGIRV